MKKIICLVLILALAFPLCACNSGKAEFYDEFVTLVEDEKYEEALDCFATKAFEQGGTSQEAYFNYLDECMNYKDFKDYYYYALALEDYLCGQYQALDSINILRKITPDFLSVNKYITEIEAILSEYDGVYKKEEEYIHNYLIIANGNVWYSFGKDENNLYYYDYDMETEMNVPAETLCENTEPDWVLYVDANQNLVIAGDWIENGDDKIEFLLDKNTKTITSSPYASDFQQGKYIKIE